jgi:hypothetical protein
MQCRLLETMTQQRDSWFAICDVVVVVPLCWITGVLPQQGLFESVHCAALQVGVHCTILCGP